MLLCPYHRKKGNQHNIKAPIIIPKVLAALCSALQLFDCCRMVDVPEKKRNLKIRITVRTDLISLYCQFKYVGIAWENREN